MSTTRFVFGMLLLAAWPLIVVGLFAFQRRYPAGVPSRYLWIVAAAAAATYAAMGAYALWNGSPMPGAALLALGAGFIVISLVTWRRYRLAHKA